MKKLAGPLLLLIVVISPALLVAQQHRALAPEDYGRWEQLQAQRTPLSPDGKWLVYGIGRSNRQNELRLQPGGGGTAHAIAFGEQPAFSSDSRWLAYLVGFSEEQEAKLRKDKKPLHKTLGLRELTTDTTVTVAGIESFSFSPTGRYLAMRRYAPESRDGATPPPGVGNNETQPPGTTLIVRELATGRDLTFGSVSEIAWQDDGSLLAMAITVDGGVGNVDEVLTAVVRGG